MKVWVIEAPIPEGTKPFGVALLFRGGGEEHVSVLPANGVLLSEVAVAEAIVTAIGVVMSGSVGDGDEVSNRQEVKRGEG